MVVVFIRCTNKVWTQSCRRCHKSFLSSPGFLPCLRATFIGQVLSLRPGWAVLKCLPKDLKRWRTSQARGFDLFWFIVYYVSWQWFCEQPHSDEFVCKNEWFLALNWSRSSGRESHAAKWLLTVKSGAWGRFTFVSCRVWRSSMGLQTKGKTWNNTV